LHARQLSFWPDPESSFNRLFHDDRTAFWLDSSLVRPGTSRFSFMGGDGGPHARSIRYFSPERRLIIEQPGETTEAQSGLFEFLAAEIPRRAGNIQRSPCGFGGGFVGYFGYELKAECGGSVKHRSEDPDSILLFPDRFLAFDHTRSRAYMLCLAGRGESRSVRRWFEETEERLRHAESLAPEPGHSSRRRLAWRLEDSRPEYLRKIGCCLEAIRAGESYQVCLTNRLRCRTQTDPLSVYRLLRRASPAPYSAFLRLGGVAIACSSPERFLKIDAAGRVESKPIKGTCPRGRTPEEDARLRESLASDAKNRSENLMIVDLVRNDLSKVCRTGSVQVAKLMDIETYATVHHMVSTVRGRLRPGATAVDCLRACFPGGSMTGAPKLRTMEIIDTLEESARGVYSGCLGYLGLDGSADLNIVIRTAVFRSGQVTVGTGGAIVALSDPEEEFDEAMLKARAVVEAVADRPARGLPRPRAYHRAGALR
jgi:para-aminobenzoate synthetase